MKRMKFIAIFTALMLVALIFVPQVALGDHDDLGLTYTVEPNPVGYKGADVRISMRVENRGGTPITGLRVEVTTLARFSETWTGTIAPHTTYGDWIGFTVPFAEGDLDTDKLLMVSIENDGDGDYADGTQVRTFQVASTEPVDITWSISPDQPVYQVGDTVEITHTYSNNFAGDTIFDLNAQGFLTLDGDHVFTSAFVDYGNVFPGDSADNTFGYTFREDDVGHHRSSYHAMFDAMGKSYVKTGWSLEFDVEAPAPALSLNATLFAAPTEIDAGDTVTFTVEIENTGDALETIVIRNSEGGEEARLEGLLAGDTGLVNLDAAIHETVDVSYFVTGASSGFTAGDETNTVTITVREPAADDGADGADDGAGDADDGADDADDGADDAAPADDGGDADEAPAADPEGAADDTAGDAAGAAETTAGEPADDAGFDDGLPDTSPTSAVIAPRGQSNLLLYIIIGVLGALVIAAAILIPIVIKRKKEDEDDKKTGKKRDKKPKRKKKKGGREESF